MLGAWALGALLLLAPAVAHAQLFVASKPNPSFMIGPLFVRASVSPDLKPVVVEILWSISVPPRRTAGDLEQDLYLLWPGGLVVDRAAGQPDPALERFITQRGFSVIESGRLPLAAQHLYRIGANEPAVRIPGGAPFVTFVRDNGPLGLTPPATWVRVPWSPYMANRAFLMSLPLTAHGLIKPKPATWAERTFWGPRYRISLSFHEVRHQAVFPLYLEHRDRVVRLAEDPAQLLIDFADTDHLKIDELFPQSAKRQISETLESTETVSMFLDSEGLSPQTLTVQFGYFTRLQSWAPILIPVLFFVLGNGAGVLVRTVTERISKRLTGRVKFGRPRETHRCGSRAWSSIGDAGTDPPGRDDARRRASALRPGLRRALTRDGPRPPDPRAIEAGGWCRADASCWAGSPRSTTGTWKSTKWRSSWSGTSYVTSRRGCDARAWLSPEPV